MQGRWLLVGIPAWVVTSAAIAYVLVFMTPWFGGYDYIATYTPRTGWYDTGSGYSFSYSYPDSVQELAKRQPAEVQALVKDLWKDLIKTDDADLYILKSLSDVCLGEIDCRGIPSKDVKPFVEAALASRQTAETATIAWRSLYVAAGSLFVSFLSVGFAALTLAKRKKAA
jgi:hypothetical protein